VIKLAAVMLGLTLRVISPGDASAQTYSISTLAGGGLPNGIQATAANLYGGVYVAPDQSGNLFFSDSVLNIVLKSSEPGLVERDRR
jgi:hypothetical protein